MEAIELTDMAPTSNEEFFDALQDEVGQNHSNTMEINEEIKQTEMDEDDLLLEKIEEAIKSPEKVETNGSTSVDDSIELSQEAETFLETLIDQKTEDELLSLEEEQTSDCVEKELEQLFNSVPPEEVKENDNQKSDSNGINEEVKIEEIEPKSEPEEEVDPKVANGEPEKTELLEESKEETPKILENECLLEECESPKEIPDDVDEQSNELPEDEESNQNEGISDHDNESCEAVTSEVTENKISEEEQKVNEEEPQKEDVSIPPLVIDENEDVPNEDIKKETTEELNATSVPDDIEMKENGDDKIEHVDEQSEDKNEDMNEPNDVDMADPDEIEKTQTQHEVTEEIEDKKSQIKIEICPPEPIKLNFMRKFAKQFVKLSREDLEELLLEKVTEAIVYRSHCTELRTQFDKQEEQIERLTKRLAAVTKQYNDLDMIHKRVEKDLKDRPDGPIQPVRITRAVGLQVFLEQRNGATVSNSNNNANKGKPLSVTTAITTTSSSNKNNSTLVVKRNAESHDVVAKHNETEPKRKKCKIITPLRPTLSEKEETSLKMQEANIEKNLRAKVAQKVSNPMHIVSKTAGPLSSKVSSPMHVAQKIASPNLSVTTVHTNGIAKQSAIPSTSIDLTDDIDELPSSSGRGQVTHPPALVAIQQRANNNLNLSRALNKQVSPVVRSPNLPQRNPNRHPAPLPASPAQVVLPNMKRVPPKPNIKINNVQNGIIVSWTVEGLNQVEHAEIQCYQIYAYEESTSPPLTENWKHVGDVKALLLPMAVTLTQFQEGQRYYFAVRAMDVYKRLGQFSAPKTWS